MNSQIKIFLSLIFFIIITISTQAFAQEVAKSDSTKHEMKKMDCCKDKSTSEKSMDCKKGTETTTVSQINAGEVDKNKNGKVFIDGMCKDVVKDEPGNCPKCGMKLKEVSLDEAKKFIEKDNMNTQTSGGER